MKRKIIIFLWLTAAFGGIATIVRAGQLSVKSYTPADGLIHERVRAIRRDSRGFLWFCTGDGLSRFDGYTFTNYNSAQGLRQPAVNDLIERRDGSYWLATSGGAILFDPSATGDAEKFTLFVVGSARKDAEVDTFYEDHAGRLWLGTVQGLFYLDESNGKKEFRRVEINDADTNVNRIAEDAEGSLWLATGNGLTRRLPDGGIVKYPYAVPGSVRAAKALMFDEANRLWVGFTGGLLILKPELASEVKSDSHPVSIAPLALAGGEKLSMPETAGTETWFVPPNRGVSRVWDLKKLSDGSVWIAVTGAGILIARNNVLAAYTTEQGLIDNDINVVEEDSAGNTWLGTETRGAMRVARHGFTAYRESDGIKRKYVREVFETKSGEIFSNTSPTEMSYLSGERFVPVKLSIAPELIVQRTLGRETPFQDHLGEWWIAARDGLYHYPKLENLEAFAAVKPDRIYTDKNGLPNLNLTAINEDSRGDIWIGTTGDVLLSRWERATGKIFSYTTADGVPPSRVPAGFAETAGGDVWFSFEEGDVLRYRAGKFHLFTAADGVPAGVIPTLFADSNGHLWIPSWRGGVARVENPADDKLVFTTYTPSNGLSSINARCVTEDAQGRIYVGTVRGVDRLENDSGRIRHYTVADGLVYSEIGTCFRDSKNTLWFATYRGLSKFTPETEENVVPSPTLINALRVAGVSVPVSELGTNAINDLQLESSQNQLQIDFFSLDFATGENLLYQYRLEGANDEWSEPTNSRTVNFANLAAGSYRFFVRAVDAAGKTSAAATINFKILSPVYRRWWFLSLAALTIAAAIFWLDRFRVKKTRQVETALEISRESAARFRTLAQTASDAIITVNKDSRIVFVNDAAEAIFGYAENELIGAELTLLMPDAFRQAHHAGMNRYLETNKRHISWAAIELPGKHKDGRMIPLELSFGEFKSDGKRYFTGIARDVSERKKAGAALQEAFSNLSVSENRFRQMNEQSPLGTVIFAPDGSIRSVNKAYEDFWGITFEQIKDWDFLSDEQIIKSGVADKLRPVFSGGTMSLPPIPYDPQANSAGVTVDEKAGVRWIQSFAYPVKSDAGELLEVILVMEDVTDSKRAAEIEQKAKTDRLRELEQVRRRIAADLHDDIGSSLTQISIFSEVLQQRVDKSNERVLEPLEFIAGSSRELVEAMSDIVWAINPQKDFLGELTGKMRRFAADVFTARDIEFTFDAPNLNEKFALGANLRREIFLIFKESINNIVKHARCSKVEIKLNVEKSEISLVLHNDGAGFDIDKITDGHGLVSMKQRAAGLGGTLAIVSDKTTGTTTTLIAPLAANADEKIL